MYSPDWNIVRQLREIDPDLGAAWDRARGCWWVTVRGKNTIRVRGDNGEYRPLDGRIVTRMREEAWRYRNRKYKQIDDEDEAGNAAILQGRYNSRRDAFRQYCVEDVHPRAVGFGEGRNVFGGWSGAQA